MKNGSRAITVGVIAERLGVPLHRVEYVLGSRPDIRPVGRAGRVRLYSQDAIEAVRREIDSIEVWRETRSRRRGGAR